MTEKGREFVWSIVKPYIPTFDHRSRLVCAVLYLYCESLTLQIIVLRDDFEEPHMHQHLVLSCPSQNLRFVSHSVAVCQVCSLFPIFLQMTSFTRLSGTT